MQNLYIYMYILSQTFDYFVAIVILNLGQKYLSEQTMHILLRFLLKVNSADPGGIAPEEQPDKLLHCLQFFLHL